MKKNNYIKLSLYEVLELSSKKYSNRTIFTFNNTKMKYNSFIDKVDECALAFKKIGVTYNDIVLLMSNTSIETIICIYALNKLSAVTYLLNEQIRESEIKDIVNTTNSEYIIISDTILNKIGSITKAFKKIITLPVIDTLGTINRVKYLFKERVISNNIIPYYRFILKGKYSKETIKLKKNDEAFIIYNNSKNILLTNRNINAYAVNNYKSENVTILTNYLISDSYGISLIHKSILNGYNFIIGDDIIKYKPNVIECSPCFLKKITMNRKINKKDLSFVELIICGKEELNDSFKEKFINYLNNHRSSPFIYSSYGLMECTSNITFNDSNNNSVGKSIDETEIKIFDVNTFNECPTNKIGEICISGPTVMKEYFDNKDETNRILVKHRNKIWLKTGDLGYLDANNYLYFKSSIKRVIISNGNRIYPTELEDIILKHPYVKECSIVGVPHPYKKEVVKAYIVLKDSLVLNSSIKKSIKEYCEERIPDYALPYSYGYRKNLPTTNNGKVAYSELINTKEEN